MPAEQGKQNKRYCLSETYKSDGKRVVSNPVKLIADYNFLYKKSKSEKEIDKKVITEFRVSKRKEWVCFWGEISLQINSMNLYVCSNYNIFHLLTVFYAAHFTLFQVSLILVIAFSFFKSASLIYSSNCPQFVQI